MPRKTPHTKNAAANSFALSHGRWRLRATTSTTSTTVKPSNKNAHSTIRPRSNGSSRGHFRCRAARTVTRGFGASGTLLDRPDLRQQLNGVGPELLGLRVLHRRRDGHEALLVDLGVDFHPELLQRLRRRRVELERLGDREVTRGLGRVGYPGALLFRHAVRGPLTQTELVAVRLVLGLRDARRGFVVLVLQHDVE